MIHANNLEEPRALHYGKLVDAGIIILRMVQRFMRIDDQWSIRYIPENNLVADGLAKLRIDWESVLHVYDDDPNEILEVLNKEQANCAFELFNLM